MLRRRRTEGRRDAVVHRAKVMDPEVISRHHGSARLSLGRRACSRERRWAPALQEAWHRSRLLHQRLVSRISPLPRMFGQPLHAGYPSSP